MSIILLILPVIICLSQRLFTWDTYGEIHKYLGAPTGQDLSKAQQDEFCTKKISSTLGGWENRLLSFEARITLLQHVLQAQPTFYTSIIKLSATMCRRVEQLYRHFTWGYGRDGRSKLALVRWDILCRPRQKGGLGIRSIADSNASLLGKWMGAILDDTAGIWSKAFGELVTACRMRHNKNVVRKEYSLPDLILTNQPLHLFGAELGSAMVSCWNVIRQDLVWDPQGIPFPYYITLRDLVILVLQTHRKADASTKQVMNELRFLKITQSETIWTRRNANRDKIFMWRVLQQALYTNARAAAIGFGNRKCPRGCDATESVSHIMFECWYAKKTWAATAKLDWGPSEQRNPFGTSDSLLQLIEACLQPQQGNTRNAQWMLTSEICRHLWLNRNQKLFSNVEVLMNVYGRVRNTLDKAISLWKESRISPPSKQWLHIAEILQKSLAMSTVTRVEKWLHRTIEAQNGPEGRSEASDTTEAATGLDPSQPLSGGAVDIF
ncbi:hypothetical protein AXG93_815s1540 [Marchantia polymorpha subsp. ruderalis]|uniref:Reverse transcriptase zinc-binding domain-containing protein n=1 Tax=Marchantia polymorpha subsp. ruderalis TaxID=1480154 RepID=A0A176W1Q5_MARPO|nr:hypothetical protein AXG93_815s1540 [Marchantia polymorpha subsp. ruderalis]